MHTEYAVFTSEELVRFVAGKKQRSTLEIELADRLARVLDHVEELEQALAKLQQ